MIGQDNFEYSNNRQQIPPKFLKKSGTVLGVSWLKSRQILPLELGMHNSGGNQIANVQTNIRIGFAISFYILHI